MAFKINAQLTIGPLLFNWQTDKIRDFYFRIADEAPIDTVYLGEIVCSKRGNGSDYLPDVLERLKRGGKRIIISSLSLIMNDKDERFLESQIALKDDYLIEANDLSAVEMLRGGEHTIGPFINIYNEAAVTYFEKGGASRITLPHELNRNSLAALASCAKRASLEIQVFGRLPLAISARCYHARAHNLSKSGCQYVCERDNDGLTVETLDNEPFLVVNGLQTLSYTYCNLMDELADLSQMGINQFRLSPHDVDMAKIADLYRACVDEKMSADEATTKLESEMLGAEFSNGFYHGEAGRVRV